MTCYYTIPVPPYLSSAVSWVTFELIGLTVIVEGQIYNIMIYNIMIPIY